MTIPERETVKFSPTSEMNVPGPAERIGRVEDKQTCNALAGEDSPYLLQHARNPVRWLPWGEPAFALARREGRPVFLSVGYSTCHWCHVMERESFEDPAVAALLNEHFVPVKVDREEHPDVDLTYMAYVQASTGQGGWPMSVFLTPEGKPFFGGTYFPPEERHGSPGFRFLLERIVAIWRDRRADLEEGAAQAVEALRQHHEGRAADGEHEVPSAETTLRHGLRSIRKTFDRDYGGFGGAPKFPRPVVPALLLQLAERFRGSPDEGATLMAVATLAALARGGIHDHVGGGFHRYAVDRIWHIPHYEKMLYDQAQLVPLFLEADRLAPDQGFADTARGILRYVARDLTHPDGGFYAAEDADSLPEPGAREKREGAFYVFRAREIDTLLGPTLAPIFRAAYGVRDEGNADPASDPHGQLTGTNTLFRALDRNDLRRSFALSAAELDGLLDQARRIVFDHRNTRPRPHRDEKVVAAWNGLMIGAMARASVRLGEPEWLERAGRAAAFVRDHLWDASQGILYRSRRHQPARIRGHASDHAQLIGGLLDLFEAGGGWEWLRWALRLQEAMDAFHLDGTDGCYFSARAQGLGLLSIKETHDGAEPAPDSTAARNLVRLSRYFHDEALARRAGRIFEAHRSTLDDSPYALPALAAALDLSTRPLLSVVIAPADGPGGPALAASARQHAPWWASVISLGSDPAERAWWIERDATSGVFPAGTDLPARAFLCHGTTCGTPLSDPEELREKLG